MDLSIEHGMEQNICSRHRTVKNTKVAWPALIIGEADDFMGIKIF